MKIVLLFLSGLFVSFITTAQTAPKEETEFTLYGFGRTVFIWDNQNLNQSDLFMPANIKVNTPKDQNFFIQSKQTRIGFNAKHTLGNDVLTLNLEGDFHNDATNANGLFRMRQAYAQYKFVLVGMTWSNFFDDEANPVNVDFEGPNSSTLTRSPQIRFSTYKTKNVLSLSFENPTEKFTTYDSVTALQEQFPDIIAAYRINGNFGFVKVATLFREFHYETDKPRSLLGYGITLITAIHAGEKDQLKFQAVMGTGVAQYIKGANGLNYDGVYNGTNILEALTMWGSDISYQHFWNDELNSSFTSGILGVDNNSSLTPTSYKTGYFASVNLFWTPVKNLTFGWESAIGKRKDINSETGSALRLQMNATYKFSKTIH